MVPIQRDRSDLSIGAIFVYETPILTWLWIDFGYTQNFDLKSKSNHDLICARIFASNHDLIWRLSKQSRIWFEMKSLLCRFDLIWIGPPLIKPYCYDANLGYSDLIWHMFKITWFDSTPFQNHVIWFGATKKVHKPTRAKSNPKSQTTGLGGLVAVGSNWFEPAVMFLVHNWLQFRVFIFK